MIWKREKSKENRNGLNSVSVFFLMIIFLFSPPSFADDETITVQISPNEIDVCLGLQPKIMTFLLGMNHFQKAGAKRLGQHIFKVNCNFESISAEWIVTNKSGDKEYTVASTVISEKGFRNVTVETLAFLLVKQTMSKLPWDGEIHDFSIAKRSAIRFIQTPENKKITYYVGETSAGFASDAELGECVPLQILRYNFGRKTAQPIGFGIIYKADKITATAEILTRSAKSANSRLFYRIIFGTSVPEWLKDGVEKCKIAAGEDRLAGLRYSEDSDFDLMRDDIIELRRVNQKGGLFVGQLATTNNIKVNTIIGGMVNNHLEIGRWASVDMRALRTFYTSPYQTSDELLKSSMPEMTIGEFYAMLRYSRGGLSIEGGPGILLDKLNLYYHVEEPSEEGQTPGVGIRRTAFRGAFQISLRYDWDEHSLTYRYARSWSQISPLFFNDLGYEYSLTDTWSVGGGANYLNLGKTIFGEPGARFTGIYGHVGISLKQKNGSK